MGDGLVGSADREHGTSMDFIAPAPTTNPVTQVGHNIVRSVYKKLTLTIR
jgi:hypothetical protein